MQLNVFADRGLAGIGYGVARAHWGRGFAVEASGAAMDWAFAIFPIAKVFATAEAGNEASHRIMEKLGMAREAVLRKGRLTRDGRRVDEVHYGVLREEWEGSRGG